MSTYDYPHASNPQENDTLYAQYTHFAQTYADYNGCLPQDDDAADHIRTALRATKIG